MKNKLLYENIKERCRSSLPVLFRHIELSSVIHTRNAILLPNVAQKISFGTIIFALLSNDSIQFQIPFAHCSVFLLKCFKCGILFLNCLLNSRIDSLNFHLMVFVDVLQFVFDLVTSLFFQVVFFSGKLFAKLRDEKNKKVYGGGKINGVEKQSQLCNGKLMNRKSFLMKIVVFREAFTSEVSFCSFFGFL